jgi:hypothetical protein
MMGRDVVRKVLAVASILGFFAYCSSLAGSLSVVVNEVFYDPEGKDGGFEFVEILNRSDEEVSLKGWSLETGNGSYVNRWTREWTGAESDAVGAHCFLVIGEESVSPRPDFVTDLDLQNGPDACRLVSPDGQIDVVGWGDLLYEEYYETSPAARAPSGSGIGRDPDGRDSGRNAEDFRIFKSPSPGDFNHPPLDLAMEKAGLSRYTSGTQSQIDIIARLLNRGTKSLGDGSIVLARAGGVKDSTALDSDIAPREIAQVAVRLANPGQGLHNLEVWHVHPADRWHDNDTLLTTIMLPPPPVVINEIMFRPGSGECEWIEIFNRSPEEVDLRDWTLQDRNGKPHSITSHETILPPKAFLVLVEDELVFSMTTGDSGAIVFARPDGGWPTLNDVDNPLGFADMVVLKEAFGTTIDSVAYGARSARPGYSVERIDPDAATVDASNWSPHYGGCGGSPGRANSVSFHLPYEGTILSLSPRTFSPDGDGRDDLLAISISLPGSGVLRLCVFDINGRQIRRLIDGDYIESRRITFWDGKDDNGTDAAVGVYIVGYDATSRSSRDAYRGKAVTILIR